MPQYDVNDPSEAIVLEDQRCEHYNPARKAIVQQYLDLYLNNALKILNSQGVSQHQQPTAYSKNEATLVCKERNPAALD